MSDAKVTGIPEIARLREALTPPAVWTEAERDGMSAAFERCRTGHYESLFAVAAFILRHRARTIGGIDV